MKRKIWITFAVSAMMVFASVTLATKGKQLRAENDKEAVEQYTDGSTAQTLTAPNLRITRVEWDIPEGLLGWLVHWSWDAVSGADLYEYEYEGLIQYYYDTTDKTEALCSVCVSDGENTITFRVRAIQNENGTKTYGPWSEMSITPEAEVDTPSNVTVSRTADGVNLSWNEVDGADGYMIWKTAGKVSYQHPSEKIDDVTETGYSFGKLPVGTYSFWVCAYKTVDNVKMYGGYSPVEICEISDDIPTNVQAQASAARVKVVWDPVSIATGYQVWRATSEEGPYTALGSVTETERVCVGLTTGTKYFFKVRAYTEKNGVREYGDFSEIVNATPTKETLSNVKVAGISSTKALVSWDKIDGAAGYQVWRATSKEGLYTALGSVTETERLCIGLTSGTTYYFKVRAFNDWTGTKEYSGFSKVVSFTPGEVNPSNVRVAEKNATRVLIAWDTVEGATGYQVWRATSEEGPYTALGSVSETERLCVGLTTGTTYYFKIRAYYSLNGTRYYSEFSDVVNATPSEAKPDTPINLEIYRVGAVEIKIKWQQVNNAAGYQVWRATSEEGPYTALGSVSNPIRSCLGLTPDTTYFFKVRAYYSLAGKKCYGEFSDVISTTTIRVNLNHPKDLKVVRQPSGLMVSWKPDGNLSGYETYQLWRATSEEGPYEKVVSTTMNYDMCYCDLKLKGKGITYYFIVRSGAGSTFGEFSEVVSMKW